MGVFGVRWAWCVWGGGVAHKSACSPHGRSPACLLQPPGLPTLLSGRYGPTSHHGHIGQTVLVLGPVIAAKVNPGIPLLAQRKGHLRRQPPNPRRASRYKPCRLPSRAAQTFGIPPPPARVRERCWASLAGTGRGQERAGSQQLPPGHLVQAKREAEDGLAGPSPPEQNASLDAQGPRDAVGACNPRTHLSTRGERTEGPAALAAGFDLGALLCRTPSCHPGLTWRHVEHCRILDGGQGLHEGVGIVRPAVPLGAECLLDVCGTGRGEGTVSACGGGGSSRAGRAAAWPSLQGSTGARGSAPHLQPPHTDRRAAASRMLQTLRTSSPEACPCCCRARLRSPRAPTGLHRERASRR